MHKDKEYGQAPIYMGNHHVYCREMMHYLYLPIKLKNSRVIVIEPRLEVFRPLLNICCEYLECKNLLFGNYLYLTAKHLFVTPDNIGNRPGWHADGFMTDDLNFIWMNKYPTLFNRSAFKLTQDHNIALKEMEEQARFTRDFNYGSHDLLLLNQYVIHRTPTITESGIRTFFKLSVSKHPYNLLGNSINPYLPTGFEYFDRQEVRNDPTFSNSDSIIK